MTGPSLTALPADFSRLPFDARRGFPQTVPFTAGSDTYQITLAVFAADMVGVLSADPALMLLDPLTAGSAWPSSVPEDPRDVFRTSAASTLDSPGVRAHLLVRQGDLVVGSQTVRVGLPMSFGLDGGAGAVVDVYVAQLVINAGSLVTPGEIGSALVAGARGTKAGKPRLESPVQIVQENPYGALT
jgi:hypothetical protein